MVRVGRKHLESKNTDDNENWKPSSLSRTYVREVLKMKAESFTNKTLHGYVIKEIIENEDVDQKVTDQWSNNKYISSYFEAYAPSINLKSVQKI